MYISRRSIHFILIHDKMFLRIRSQYFEVGATLLYSAQKKSMVWVGMVT